MSLGNTLGNLEKPQETSELIASGQSPVSGQILEVVPSPNKFSLNARIELLFNSQGSAQFLGVGTF